MWRGDHGINTCVWGRRTKELIHVYGEGGTRELIRVCVCGGGGGTDKEVIHVCVEVGPSTICVCGRETRNYYVYVRDQGFNAYMCRGQGN